MKYYVEGTRALSREAALDSLSQGVGVEVRKGTNHILIEEGACTKEEATKYIEGAESLLILFK